MKNSVTLGSISTMKTGPFGTQLSADEYTSTGTPVINVRNIGYGEIITDTLEYINNSTRNRLSTHLLRTGDIVFGRKGSVDRHAYIDEQYNGWMQGSDCIRLRFQAGINSRYVSHFLKLNYVKKQINNAAVGSTMASLNTDILNRVKIILPSLEKQNKLEQILSILESKITLNKRINAELEAMAKTLYDYWFVQFDFPDENGKPYRTSGGAMEWNEQLKMEIPKGWKVESALSAFDVCYGYPFDTLLFTEDTTQTPVVRIRDILNCETSAYTTEKVDDKFLLKSKDLIIGMDGNFHMNFWSSVSALLNQRCVRIRGSGCHSVMQAYFTSTPYIKAREKNVNRTTVGHLSADDIKALYVLTANDDLQKKITSIFESILEKICAAKEENLELTRLRDWLLPMLMNGQGTVVDEEPIETPQNFVEMPSNNKRFDLWLQNQGIAARGDLDKKTLREIFDAMDDDDK